jgi:hypothetical protein
MQVSSLKYFSDSSCGEYRRFTIIKKKKKNPFMVYYEEIIIIVDIVEKVYSANNQAKGLNRQQ